MIAATDSPTPVVKKVRGTYKPRTKPNKPRTKPRKLETKPRAKRKATVDRLGEFEPQLMRAFKLAESNSGVIPRKAFYSADSIKKIFGKPAHARFKQFFAAERTFNYHRANELDQKFREGKITEDQKRALFVYCCEYQWRIKLKKTMEVHNMLLDWEDHVARKMTEARHALKTLWG